MCIWKKLCPVFLSPHVGIYCCIRSCSCTNGSLQFICPFPALPPKFGRQAEMYIDYITFAIKPTQKLFCKAHNILNLIKQFCSCSFEPVEVLLLQHRILYFTKIEKGRKIMSFFQDGSGGVNPYRSNTLNFLILIHITYAKFKTIRSFAWSVIWTGLI